MPSQRDDKDPAATGQALLYLMLPVIVACLLGGVLAWIAARHGAPRWVVRLLCFPAVFALSNFVGVCLVVGASFFLAMAKGTADAMLYRNITDYLDLTLYVVWGPFLGWVWNFDVSLSAYAPRVPWWHIAVYQLGVWFAMAQPIYTVLVRLVSPACTRS